MTEADIKLAFLNVLKTDTAGAAVRTALTGYGSGVSSIIGKDEMSTNTLPTCPFLALQWGPSGGVRRGATSYFPTWWVYDNVRQGFFRVNALLELIRLAYPESALAYCYVDTIRKTGEIRDANYNLMPCRGFPFQIRAASAG